LTLGGGTNSAFNVSVAELVFLLSMPHRTVYDGLAAIPRRLPPAWRGTLRRLYKAVVPQPFFDLDDAIKWLLTLKEHGVAFGFPEDLADRGGQPSLAILKHDIHDDLNRAVAMAAAESARGICGLYFMMGPHELNRTFYGSARTWELLRTIQDMGHRIGLHLDPFDALRRNGLYEFIGRTITEFSREGITIRYGNSHGDSKYESLGIRQQDFFAESMDRIPITNTSPSKMASQAGKYSLEHLASHFGLEYWVDSRIFQRGVRLQRTVYVSDNAGQIRIRSRGPSSRRYEIDAAFVAQSVPLLMNAQSLILLHPQWYTSRT
jgi:hypothetical protein